jgi:hypothetical protein
MRMRHPHVEDDTARNLYELRLLFVDDAHKPYELLALVPQED